MNQFYMEKGVTRAQALKVIAIIKWLKLLSAREKPFLDVELGQWYTYYVYTFKIYGLVEGYEKDNSFKPNDFITRAETAKLIVMTEEWNGEE